jgi:CG-1 domain
MEAQHRWLRPAEICEILKNYKKFRIAPEPPSRPPSTNLFSFSVCLVSFLYILVFTDTYNFLSLCHWIPFCWPLSEIQNIAAIIRTVLSCIVAELNIFSFSRALCINSNAWQKKRL